MHKFEKLEVWQLAIEYADLCYSLAEQMPKQEEYNLSSQLRRAAVSVALNIAEGSTLGHHGLREDIEEYQVDSRTPFDEFDNHQ
jgi:four helix bundle protein